MEKEIAKVQVGTGMYGSGYWLKEIESDTQGYRLVLEQDVDLPAGAIEIVLELARQFRAMRERCRSERDYTELSAVNKRADRMFARFCPADHPAEKLREVAVHISGRTVYMAISSLLRMADTLSRFSETGKLEDIRPQFRQKGEDADP